MMEKRENGEFVDSRTTIRKCEFVDLPIDKTTSLADNVMLWASWNYLRFRLIRSSLARACVRVCV